MPFVRYVILAILLLCCPVYGHSVQAEQVHVTFGADRAFGTVISRGDGPCVLLTVAHVFSNPRLTDYRVFSANQPRPQEPNLEPLGGPPGMQSTLDAQLGQLTGWTGPCPMSLGTMLSDTWTDVLNTNAAQTGFSNNLFLRLIDGGAIRDVPVKLDGTPYADTFSFFIDPGVSGTIPDRAGISGSGVYYSMAGAERDGQLVGIVSGTSVNGNAYSAIRIESIARVLGLVSDREQGGSPPEQAPVAADQLALPVPQMLTECDRSAANKADPARHPDARGLEKDFVKIEQALPYCLSAIAKFPGSPRLIYQLGRVYALDYEVNPEPGKFATAIDTLNQALALGHAHAIANLEVLLVSDQKWCKDSKTCLESYMYSLDLLEEFDPRRARIERNRLRVYSSFSDKLCPDKPACLAELAAAYDAIPADDPAYIDAQAQIAFLVLNRGFQRDCPGDAGCRGFMQRAFAVAAKDSGWAGRALGDLYSANDAVPGGCATRDECRVQAVAAWQLAGELRDGWSYDRLADRAYEADWHAAFGCLDAAACSKLSYGYYVAAAELGITEARTGAVWFLINAQKAAGCADNQACMEVARVHFADTKFAATPYGKVRLAQAIELHPESFADLCSPDTCPKTVFDLYFAGVNTTWGYPAWRVAEFYRDDMTALRQNPSARVVTGCTDPASCAGLALEWYPKAVDKGATETLDNWLYLMADRAWMAEDEPKVMAYLNSELLTWLERVERQGGPRLSDTDEAFLGLLRETEGMVPALCDGYAERCAALREAILNYGITTNDADYVRDMAEGNDCFENCDQRQITVLGRAAAAGSTAVFATHAYLLHLDQRACPFPIIVCEQSETKSFADFIQSADLIDLAALEGLFDLSYGWSHVPDKAFAEVGEILIAKGSSGALTLTEANLLQRIYDTEEVDDISAEQARTAADAFLATLHRGGRTQSVDQAALHLMFLSMHEIFEDISADTSVDLTMMFLLVTGRGEENNWNIWIGNRPDLVAAVQRRLGVDDDGVFGEESWAAAEQIAADYALFGRTPVLGKVEESEETTAQDIAAARARLERIAPEKMMQRIRRTMSL